MWLNSKTAPPLIATVWSQKHLRTQTCRGVERTWRSSLLEALQLFCTFLIQLVPSRPGPGRHSFWGHSQLFPGVLGFRVSIAGSDPLSLLKAGRDWPVSPLGNSFLPLRASHLKKRVVGGEELSFSLGGLKQPSDGAET